MGSDTAVRAVCSMLNISRVLVSLLPPSRRVGVPLARERGAEGGAVARRRVQWHRRGRQQRQHGRSGDATAC